MMLRVRVEHQFAGFRLDAMFDAKPGVTALFGPSGSGKTSVIRAVAGLLRCDRAEVSLAGRDMGPVPVHKRKFGYVFQEPRLFPHLSVLQNLRYGGRAQEDRVIEVLGLGGLLARRPGALSGGEAQRVALGRALMADPDVLLMDEPLSALDGPRKDEVLPYLEALRDQSDVPILYVSHDMSEVARLARDIVILNEGAVVLSGDVQDVMSDPAAVRFIGVAEAGAVLVGHVVGHADDGLTKVDTPGGDLWVPGVIGSAGAAVRVRIPAQDIILARERPAHMSALNVLRVKVTKIEQGTGPGAAVGLAAGRARLLARITKRSCHAMGLAPGQEVYAIVKANGIAAANVALGA